MEVGAAPRGYAYLEHTADVGIEAWGADLGEAFVEAALATCALMVDASAVRERVARRIAVSGDDPGDLLVRWLSELVYLVDAHGLVFRRFAVEQATAQAFAATAYGEPLDPGRHRPAIAVKAVTYHGLAVEPGPPARVRVILDV